METYKKQILSFLFTFAAVLTVGTLVFTFLLGGDRKVLAANERIITIFADGMEKTIVTDAKTVSEAIERAGIKLAEKDAVEPKRDTELHALSYNINVYRARPITVIDGQRREVILSPHTSARQIAEDVGIKVYDEDTLTLSRIDNFLEEGYAGLKLTIKRSVPLKMILYGKRMSIRTQATTVTELMQEKGIIVASSDKLWPSGDTPIEKDMTVAIYGLGTLEIKEEPVDFEVERILDKDREVGYREVKERGKKGKRFVIYRIDKKNGKTTRVELQSYVMVKPKKQVEVVGVKSEGYSGTFGEALAALRQCEAGGNYANKNNPLYRGAYQFSYQTWAGNGGYYDPADAPPSLQDAAAAGLYQRRGWQPWPACSAKLGLQDIYR